jgi:signal-transduction protein with cAMP-binding, CBS, and nucleotidyltransferase domain
MGTTIGISNVAQFRAIRIFDGLTDDQLLVVAAKSKTRYFERGRELVSIHDTCGDVFFILSGRVQIRTTRQAVGSSFIPRSRRGRFLASFPQSTVNHDPLQ